MNRLNRKAGKSRIGDSTVHMIILPLPENPRNKLPCRRYQAVSSKQDALQLLAEMGEVDHVDKGSPQSSGRPSP